MWKIKYRLFSVLSDHPMSEKEYRLKNKKFNQMVTVALLFLIPIVLIFYSEKDYRKAIALCSKGVQTVGIIKSIVVDNSNEANISSWMIGYYFTIKGKKYTGEIENNTNPTQNNGDTIKVVYAADNPDINAGFLTNIDVKCITYGYALWKNSYLLIIGLALIVLLNFEKK